MCPQIKNASGQSRYHIVLSRDERESLEKLAALNERSLAGEIRLALRKHIDQAQDKAAWTAANSGAAA